MSGEQGFPNVTSPMVMAGSFMPTQPWYQLLLTLWNRTGGAQSAGTGGVVTGEIKLYGGATVPSGYLTCDGTAVSRNTYSALFAAIGTSWGVGDGTLTFNLPNLVNRAPIGSGGTYPLGSYGGANEVTLNTNQLPSHNHGITDPGHTHTFTGIAHTHTITDPGHLHTSSVAASNVTVGAGAGGTTAGNTGSNTTGITINNATAGGTNTSEVTGISTDLTGSGDPVSTLPPYGAVKYIIKT